MIGESVKPTHPRPAWNRYLNRLLAREVSSLTRYYDRVVYWSPRPTDSGLLIEAVDSPSKTIVREGEEFPDCSQEKDRRTAVVLNGTLNHSFDIQGQLQALHARLSRTSRLVAIAYNPYLSGLWRLANRLGVRKGELPTTFVSETDLDNIARLSGYEVVRTRLIGYVPWRLLGLGTLLNWLLPAIPGLRWLGLASVVVLRPVIANAARPSLTIVIPARNERGNIENALTRMPDFGAPIEVIFVEGHSTDGTWEEIQRVVAAHEDQFTLKAVRQEGKGKADAVRLGFSLATGDLLTILDADLTMPPELLTRFYEAYVMGLADFVNGTRLVYPMEGEAMRFLNRLGNVLFAKALSAVLGTPLGDSLCGTKLVARHDYARMIAWRRDFGDFDPFGDFELLFPAATLGLGIVDVPIRYLARTYGTTNISRFRHGLLLLRMTLIGLLRIRMGKSL